MTYAPVGQEFAVNSTYARSQLQSDSAQLATGGKFVIVWVDADFNTTANRFIKAQIYGTDGAPIGGEITLASGSSFINPAVAGLTGGGFVVTWEGSTTVRAQVFDDGGGQVSQAIDVSPLSASGADRPDVTALAQGGFAVSWHDIRTGGADISGSGVHVRGFNADGSSNGAESLVNATTGGNQADSSVAALPAGGYVVTWTDRGASSWLVKARLFDPAGAPVGQELVVNSPAEGVSSVESAVAALTNGNFAVAWYQSDTVLGSSHQIQVFTASGERLGDQITVPSYLNGTQVGPKLIGLLDGGFAVAWTANSAPYSDGSLRGVFVQAFDSGGQPSGEPMLVNGQTLGDQFDPSIVALKSGGFAVSWSDLNGSGADDDQVKAQIFLAQQPVTIVSDGGGDSAQVVAGENQLGATQVAAVAGGSSTGITYAIVGGEDAARFTIDATTGALGFVMPPDFEAPTGDADNLYRVEVRASNATSADTQAITVRVADVNEAPRITSGGGGTSAALSLPENSTAVTMVSGSDPEGSAVRYAITGGPDATLFAIDPQTGAVTFVAPPDFELPADFAADNFYKVIISASDGVLASEQALEIVITNVNEGLTITSGGGADSAAVTVQENGLTATSLTAVDLDGDQVAYSIAGGADAGRFAIDPGTGALVFLVAPNFEAPADTGGDNRYDVVVRASDGVFSDTQALAISITNQNEAPVITSGGGGDIASITINENTTAVTTVASTDPDGDTRTYALTGVDAGRFNLNPTTGLLTFVGAPDFEAPSDADRNNVYNVIVSASDGFLTDTQSLSVTVRDVAEPANIVGTAGNDLISGSQTVAGQPLATAYNDRIEGRGGNDTLSGGDGADTIDGGSGSDRLQGDGGADSLNGGAGADVFEFGALAESRPGAADVINDFNRQEGDRISLVRIDARMATSADDAFKFIGTKAFSKEAGQLRFEQAGPYTRILGDVNGDGVADFQIDVIGAVKFVASDFLV